MPWEIHLYALGDTYLYMFSLRGGARTDLYTCLVALYLVWKRVYVCTHMDYTRYRVYVWILYILYTRMDTLLKLPLGVSDGKPKIFSSKIFLTKVLFLETKASELSIC